MYTILKFLKEKFEIPSNIQESIDLSDNDIERVNRLFSSNSKVQKESKHLKIRPRFQQHQIWSVKSEYFDFFGNPLKTSHPFLVLINSEPGEIDDEEFLRVFIISPFIEMASSNDEVCQDSSIVGFPFLVEIWNDQPILAEILNEYIGFYETKSTKSWELQLPQNLGSSELSATLDVNLNSFQREFRDIEISNAKYLNHSITALLTFLENKQSQDSGVIVSMLDKIVYPKFFIGNNQKEDDYMLVARSAIDTEDKYMLYENKSIPIKIFFRRDEDGFILTIMPFGIATLIDSNNELIVGTSNSEKTVYSNLKKGLYALTVEPIKEPIKIRLK
jgi:hypothetical protein